MRLEIKDKIFQFGDNFIKVYDINSEYLILKCKENDDISGVSNILKENFKFQNGSTNHDDILYTTIYDDGFFATGFLCKVDTQLGLPEITIKLKRIATRNYYNKF